MRWVIQKNLLVTYILRILCWVQEHNHGAVSVTSDLLNIIFFLYCWRRSTWRESRHFTVALIVFWSWFHIHFVFSFPWISACSYNKTPITHTDTHFSSFICSSRTPLEDVWGKALLCSKPSIDQSSLAKVKWLFPSLLRGQRGIHKSCFLQQHFY